jgi:hypothetical protein
MRCPQGRVIKEKNIERVNNKCGWDKRVEWCWWEFPFLVLFHQPLSERGGGKLPTPLRPFCPFLPSLPTYLMAWSPHIPSAINFAKLSRLSPTKAPDSMPAFLEPFAVLSHALTSRNSFPKFFSTIYIFFTRTEGFSAQHFFPSSYYEMVSTADNLECS